MRGILIKLVSLALALGVSSCTIRVSNSVNVIHESSTKFGQPTTFNKKLSGKLQGFWKNLEDPSFIRLFDGEGNYFTLHKEGGQYIVSLKGKYSILSSEVYRETAENDRKLNDIAFKGVPYDVTYDFSHEFQVIKFSGIVKYKDGRQPAAWQETYARVQTLN